MHKQIQNLYHLKKHRKYLRTESTSAECVLWCYLKSKQLHGRKFRRQHSIENMIVDFYCPAENINIELDGEEHFTEQGLEKDRIRDQRLNDLGYTVLRFENSDLLNNIDSVLDDISKSFNRPLPTI